MIVAEELYATGPKPVPPRNKLVRRANIPSGACRSMCGTVTEADAARRVASIRLDSSARSPRRKRTTTTPKWSGDRTAQATLGGP